MSGNKVSLYKIDQSGPHWSGEQSAPRVRLAGRPEKRGFRYSNRVRLGINEVARVDRALKGIVGKRLTYRTLHH